MEDIVMCIPNRVYYAFRWPGDEWNHGINSHDIDIVFPAYSDSNTEKVNDFLCDIYLSVSLRIVINMFEYLPHFCCFCVFY